MKIVLEVQIKTTESRLIELCTPGARLIMLQECERAKCLSSICAQFFKHVIAHIYIYIYDLKPCLLQDFIGTKLAYTYLGTRLLKQEYMSSNLNHHPSSIRKSYGCMWFGAIIYSLGVWIHLLTYFPMRRVGA